MSTVTAETETQSAPPSSATLPVVLAAQFVTPMAIAGTAIALPLISRDLGSNPTALQWVVNGFNIAFALTTLLWGAASDRIGHRRTFGIGAALVVAGSVGSVVAPNLLVLDSARVIAGVGAAAILTGATALLSTAYEGPRRIRAFAVFGTVNGLGLALGPTISGVLISLLDWRGVFVVHAVILAAAGIGTRLLPAAKPAVTEHGPILDLGLLRNREFLAMCLVPVAGSIGFVTLLTYLPSALSGITDLSAGTSGLLMLAMTIPVFVAPVAIGQLVTRFPSLTIGKVVFLSLVALILGNAGVLALSQDRSVAWIILPMVLLGLGFGLPIGLVDGHALSVVPADRGGTAAGVLNFFRIGSEAIFVAGYAVVLSAVVGTQLSGSAADDTAAGQYGHPDVYRSAFTTTVGVLIALLVVLTILIVVVRGTARVTENREIGSSPEGVSS
ncbi:Predicted arabinose efflux permease, MFS family [Nocardia amikacinitolerans]|uniref:Predicted arabinose efflux permease, MFS family n=1 Tax=Nocardia amikacinitolerans TaxID=756689 RepID=A0A285LX25_9NOCA|nr:MFS transporter [Nocardia amikacinitolerans]MCP2279542.1 putative arabinose efflux permease, MFS family [Nocardia amikacinitolerans]MCP2298568.1 putative arabinose efflux permease, MFS family [Nocardia amikacinitolerans]SNY89462.1 Predicted arabinose efflux permease, MFS family [Nocardia amikacinitolerans]